MGKLLRAPFVYAGGKSRVADVVWAHLGSPRHYIEPFCGSAAVLLARPQPILASHAETLNDLDGMVVNAWRAIKHSPEDVVRWMLAPVSTIELYARRKYLVERANTLRALLEDDVDYHDARAAGYWLYCANVGLGKPLGCVRTNDVGEIVSWYASRVTPSLTHVNNGIVSQSHEMALEWLKALGERFARVRILCSDWSRLMNANWLDRLHPTGVFFDPPYDVEHYEDVYAIKTPGVARAVREWCIAHGDDPNFRIVLAGYYEEHEELLSHGWRVHRWVGSTTWNGRGRRQVDRFREALFISPHCAHSSLFPDL